MKFSQKENSKILSNFPLIKFTILYYYAHYSPKYGNWTFKWHIIDNNGSIFPVVRQGISRELMILCGGGSFVPDVTAIVTLVW